MCGHTKEDLVYGHLSDWIVKSVEFRNFVRMPSSQAVLGGRSREGAVVCTNGAGGQCNILLTLFHE